MKYPSADIPTGHRQAECESAQRRAGADPPEGGRRGSSDIGIGISKQCQKYGRRGISSPVPECRHDADAGTPARPIESAQEKAIDSRPGARFQRQERHVGRRGIGEHLRKYGRGGRGADL